MAVMCPYLLHSSCFLPMVSRRKLHRLAHGEQPLGVVDRTVDYHATGASEIVHHWDGAHGEVLRYGLSRWKTCGRSRWPRRASRRHRPQSVPEPVEETCHIVNRRGKEVLGGDAVPNGENDGTGVPRVVVRLKARPPRWLKREWQWLLYLPSSSVVAAPRHFAWMRRRLHRATVCHGQAGGAHCKWASEEDWKKGEEDKSKTVILFVFSLINWMDIIF